MADTALKKVNIDTQAHVELLQKDVGSSQHVPGMMVVGSDGSEGGPGADTVADVQKVEHRFVHSGLKVADALIKTGPGFLHALQFSQNDAAPTAGTIDVYDNTSASGTKLFSWTMTTAVFTPFSVILDVPFAIGLYFDFTTTADVNVSASYR